MAVLGDPPPPSQWESRTPHGGVPAVTYVPTKAAPLSRKVGDRKGGRRPVESRVCHLRVGAVPNAAGSAFLEQGNTKIIAAVYGPRQATDWAHSTVEGVLSVEMQFAPFASAFLTKEENEKRAVLYGSILQGALESVVFLERYGKTIFDVSIFVLEDDGAALTSALTACTLALADASVEMCDLAAGATVHLSTGPKGEAEALLLDCDAEEQLSLSEGSAVLHVGFCHSSSSLCMMHSAGTLPPGPLEQMMLLAKDTAEAVGAEIRRCLEGRVDRRAVKRLKLAANADVELDT
eukprot:TRINITY_DN51383_c0_g1_i1.p1 TRINITY_DN51383_c0_g1~~TRINITY_DN51383_c0_g1_i1.p1  ORF type:complete len:292 (-),score=56.71 TRINITY_DN51383_c0_g1_i1:97-972(-)